MPIDLTYLNPPEEDSINVLALTADTASSAQAMWSANAGMKSTKVTFIGDEEFYITISKDPSGTVTDPVIADTSGGSRTWLVPRATPTTFHLGSRNRYFKAISTSTTKLRWRVED